ncbi:MAG: hypothetical protein J6113_08410, partial [Lachnospiraceae bacterium]|nr:hypothetical protein [Lachnospiraceae bacterium]
DTFTESAEAFFVKKRLDLKRRKENRRIAITVFSNFSNEKGEMKGFADIFVFPGIDKEELVKKLRDAKYAAGFVANPTYDLGKAEKGSVLKNLPDIEEGLMTMSKALFSADTGESAFVNSAEVFATKKRTNIIMSNGTDVTYNSFRISGEFVAQCKEPQDVETYMDFAYDGLDTESLKKLVAETLETTLARAKATEAPKAGKYRVMISGRYVKDIFGFYEALSSDAFIYAKYSKFKVGDAVQGSDVTGDKFNMSLKALEPFSSEGIRMKDLKLLKDGVLLATHGPKRFAHYLGVEATGNYSAFTVEPGTVSIEEMKKEPYLNIVNFSDFQLNEMNGSFGGEIRLAFLFDGEKVTPVTGGSINGNFIELQKNARISKETQKQLDYEGPYAICFESINVAGK